MTTTSTNPNIVLFITDDHGAWANGCYGNTEVQTPTLDRLAAEGARLSNAFTPTPVCSPAKSMLAHGAHGQPGGDSRLVGGTSRRNP